MSHFFKKCQSSGIATCSVCWTSLSAARLYIIARPDSSSQSSITMSKPKRDNMMNVCVRSSTVFSHPLCCLQLCEATTFYQRLADLINSKQQKHYSNVISWLRCHLSIAILQSAIIISPLSELWGEYYPCNQNCHCGSFYFLYVWPPSFLIIQWHCITQFTLYKGINIWPHQTWLTIPVYTWVFFHFFFFLVITHRSTIFSILISALINKYKSLTLAPSMHALPAPSTYVYMVRPSFRKLY